MSKNTFSAILLLGALTLTGAGCFGSSSIKGEGSVSKPSSRPPAQQEAEYDDKAEVDVEAETPDIDANSTVEDYEEVSAEIEDLSNDIEEMNAEINSLNNTKTDLE